MRLISGRSVSLPAAAMLAAMVCVQSLPSQRSAVSADSLATALSALAQAADDTRLPRADQFTFGDRTVNPGGVTAGPVAVANGTLHVRGRVDGDVVAYNGDVVLEQGGDVRGNAYAVLGKVTFAGGTVSGDARALSGDLQPVAAVAAAAESRSGSTLSLRAIALAFGWLGVLVVVGIGVLVFASTNLDAVTEALEHDFGRSFLTGVAGQLVALPALVVIVIALALTVLGILLIPFAIVAYVLAVAGLLTLGYLAIARVAGRTFFATDGTDERRRRAAALRTLLAGLILVMSPWFVAGGLAWSPTAGLVARTVALAVTWVALTAGLGAAMASRGGVRRFTSPSTKRALASASWQTPTPVSGVVAGRRPTPMSNTGAK